MLIDTHCHVHFNAYKQDMDEVIRRALAQNVLMITVGTQSTTSKNGLLVAEKYDGVWAAVGLHPNHLCEQEFWDEQELEEGPQALRSAGSQGSEGSANLKTYEPENLSSTWQKVKTRCETFDRAYYLELARHPKCVAIGECGLDYYRLPEHIDREEIIEKQKQTVRGHFDVATEADKPVVIHCRDAHDDQAAIIQEYVDAGKLGRRGIIHCFTGTLEEAKRYIDLGFYISFSGVITFPPRKADKSSDGLSPLQRVVRDLPLDRILAETDAPYLTPDPHRGKRNEPAYVVFTAQKIADLKGLSLDDITAVTTRNAKQVFFSLDLIS